ncbi:efflux RND transporter permease subunit [Occallatibacter riparius]|uniref:Efflux RND transporter permease subunit n=1 Tax=Occallatibacter riparius TaxID=1002689 RepID=A0A9J7BY97_9BACT|nr:efflux RND transporter permease subunit [Occallatibacter riparius]
MWIVRLALRRPYTFVVFAFLILIVGVFSIESMPTDIFPNINIPIVTVVWSFNGLSAEQMANRIVSSSERGMTTTVNDIEHIESNSLNGIAVIKVFFQPHVNVANAVAQVTSISQVMLRQLPPGTNPPFIIQYNASSVPVLQLGLSGEGLDEQRLFDTGQNTIRTQLATVEGAQTPYPYGGKQRQIQVDLDLNALQAKGLSPSDVVNAINAQNVIAPAGTMKIDRFEYAIETNSTPEVVAHLNQLPIKAVNGAIIYIRDVAHVRDGSPPQTNIVRVDGRRAILMSILKVGSSSTLEIIDGVRSKIEGIKGQLPEQLKISTLSDQGIFVRGAIEGVVREGIIAACLTGVMILVFLGSWRSTLIIAVSIPLSILCSLACLAALGETINIMTLGGLALAVGILVDDATVEIENINRNLEAGKEIEQAILDGAAQIATPALVSTLAICIVFVPMFFLSGVSKYLFVPMAEAVVFAMLASYLLSRTVVPTMARYLLHEHDDAESARKQASRNPFTRFQLAFEERFEKIRIGYLRFLTLAVHHAGIFLVLFVIFAIASVGILTPFLGQDFFPTVDSGSFKIHVRAHTGTRIEETAALCDHIDATIRQNIPSDEIVNIVDNIGLPYSGLNLSYSTSAPVGPADADIQVQLTEKHHPTDNYVENLRTLLANDYPGVTFYVLPVDIVTQILNFGLAAPIDIQIIGPRLWENRALAERMLNEIRYVPGAADARIQQPFDYPKMTVDVDRTRAESVGLTQRDVAQSILISLSGSFQTAPNFYLDPRNGVSYNIATQSPQYRLDSMAKLQSLPISGSATAQINPTVIGAGGSPTSAASITAPGTTRPVQVLGNLASIQPGAEIGEVSHYDVQPVIDIFTNVRGTDLGTVTREMQRIVNEHKKELPRGSQFILRGQSETMYKSYIGLLGGLAMSILLVYLLIVVNFQSWLDPFLIISALPAALAGIVWFLFLTDTRLSVPALTGAIMCMGVATANSILVVSFAREQLEALVGDAQKAALNAGFVRFRPVLMTALAMIIGMVPMALGLGEGGEQNAPLGRAVIGGLLLATTATLFFVPVFFSVVHGWLERRRTRTVATVGATLDEFDQ